MFTRLTYVCRTNRGLTSGYMWHICPVPGKSDTYPTQQTRATTHDACTQPVQDTSTGNTAGPAALGITRSAVTCTVHAQARSEWLTYAWI